MDFYSSEHHASNVGQIFRPGQPALTAELEAPADRLSRPRRHGRGQRHTDRAAAAGSARPETSGPRKRLDIEAEVGFVVGVGSRQGESVPWQRFGEHVFGVVLVNDWSARDIQAWEYQPLGPFLGKSFATSVSAWITPLAALDSAWTAAPAQDPAVLPYLADDRRALGLDIAVEWNGFEVSRPPFASMYWTPAQQLAHLTVNGASLRTGDLFASGTVSGPARAEVGSFLELSWNGTEPVALGRPEAKLSGGRGHGHHPGARWKRRDSSRHWQGFPSPELMWRLSPTPDLLPRSAIT